MGFLSVAADLMDAYLQAEPIGHRQSQQLGHFTFPTALEWLRTDDVIRLAPKWSSGEAARRRAFFSRWPTRDAFLADAVVYALLREQPEIPTQRHAGDTSMSQLIGHVTEDLLTSLVQHPRSYLVLHLGPLLPRHPELTRALSPGSHEATRAWLRLYHMLSDQHDLVLRPEWTFKRLASVLQAMLDGFVLRYRLRPGGHPRHSWKEANILADAVVALLLGAVDWNLSGQSGREALDSLT
ncbi:hypothetical protein [Actinophytocola oryzae]|uniref:TetR family transcriptional regulator n=1 Tax=Actinophytocola oryzae TaxID=502181 RepID=A0A4R7USF0_9PSEU|nr:hypothetical protein [Actinophytocola oryzae]TDV38703.1 hypothetical protein CLV71_12689 [Actinophytocola oryzae]